LLLWCARRTTYASYHRRPERPLIRFEISLDPIQGTLNLLTVILEKVGAIAQLY